MIGLGLTVLNITIIVTLRHSTFYVHESGWEYNAVMAVVGLLLMAHGSGRAGLDHLFIQPKDDEPTEQLIDDTAPV